MATDQTKFTRIAGLSEKRQLPRLGKIRLGIKVKKAQADSRCKHRPSEESCHYCTYPKEVSYFVVPPEVARVYGEQPTELDVMFPIENEFMVFPQSYKWYVAEGLRCKGNGQTAMRRVADLAKGDRTPLDEKADVSDPNGLVEVGCTCPLLESGECKENANLMVLLPRVSLGGVYQVNTGSVHNIIRINSNIDYVRGVMNGRISLVPLKLIRQEEEVMFESKKRKHYLLQLVLNVNLDEVRQLRENSAMILSRSETLALPAPVEDGPEPTGPAPTEEEPPVASPVAEAPPERGGSLLVDDWITVFEQAQDEATLKSEWSRLTAKGSGLWWRLKGQDQARLIMARDKRKAALKAKPAGATT
jgi:hypothetical protein